MKKQIFKGLILTVCLALVLSFAGCAAEQSNAVVPSTPATQATAAATTTVASQKEVSVVTIAGPTGVGMVNMLDISEKKFTTNKYNANVVTAPTDAVAALTGGKAQIAALPTNLAASLYKKTNGNIRILIVNTLGVLYMLENGDTIQSVADLRGKTIYSTGQGANPEYILNYILTQNGLTPGTDVNIVYLEQNEELVARIASGEATIAMVPQPVAATVMNKVSTLRTALSINDEWNKVAPESSLMMGCVVATKDFMENHQEELNTFLMDYQYSTQQTLSDTTGTAQLCVKYGIIANADVAAAAIPKCNICYIGGSELKTKLTAYLQVLYDANPQSVGGSLPDDDFYYAAD